MRIQVPAHYQIEGTLRENSQNVKTFNVPLLVDIDVPEINVDIENDSRFVTNVSTRPHFMRMFREFAEKDRQFYNKEINTKIYEIQGECYSDMPKDKDFSVLYFGEFKQEKVHSADKIKTIVSDNRQAIIDAIQEKAKRLVVVNDQLFIRVDRPRFVIRASGGGVDFVSSGYALPLADTKYYPKFRNTLMSKLASEHRFHNGTVAYSGDKNAHPFFTEKFDNTNAILVDLVNTLIGSFVTLKLPRDLLMDFVSLRDIVEPYVDFAKMSASNDPFLAIKDDTFFDKPPLVSMTSLSHFIDRLKENGFDVSDHRRMRGLENMSKYETVKAEFIKKQEAMEANAKRIFRS